MRILIVEDEALVAMEVASILEDAGHVIADQADDLSSAEAAAASAYPDLALVDIQLAHGDSGIDVAASLRRLGIPVIFVTGNCPLDRGKGLALACLHKPVSDRALTSTIGVAQAVLSNSPVKEMPHTLHLY